jgi:hypothetical protein
MASPGAAEELRRDEIPRFVGTTVPVEEELYPHCLLEGYCTPAQLVHMDANS